jgi:regulator of protease activity HflC (stomatin/prohibitin superfamily)
MVDRRIQTVEIPGQEILTGDKVSIRVNVWAAFQVVDAAQARQSVIGQETLSSTSCFDLSH